MLGLSAFLKLRAQALTGKAAFQAAAHWDNGPVRCMGREQRGDPSGRFGIKPEGPKWMV